MGKKGKRKTRWRALSIGAPPGEGDDEDGLRNGYSRENGLGSRGFDRNSQTGHKPRRSGVSDTGSDYGGGSRSRKVDAPGSPSQPKIIFNEDEYTRITTPRQDVLFKKGYLSRKKPGASTTSTSATPSTTESQSASHSTADGSETTDDQQLLDRDSAGGEYPQTVESGAQMGYGTFYDHGSGYYYEYPVMLVGPPLPGQLEPNVLAAVPCGPVPLRPIEWVNPDFVPKFASQQYCLVDYQTGQIAGPAPAVEPQPVLLPAEPTNANANANGNGNENENGNGNGNGNESGNGSVNGSTGAAEEERNGDHHLEDAPVPYPEVAVTQPVHVQHVVHPPMPQPYLYPGHFMFGPPLVNVNGVTIQGGPMARSTEISATTVVAGCPNRRKKKKRRKQRRAMVTGNTEDEEEEEYSSEGEGAATNPRLTWTNNASSGNGSNRPLNPECQEFQLRGEAPSAQRNDEDATTSRSVEETNPGEAVEPGREPPPENGDETSNDGADREASSRAGGEEGPGGRRSREVASPGTTTTDNDDERLTPEAREDLPDGSEDESTPKPETPPRVEGSPVRNGNESPGSESGSGSAETPKARPGGAAAEESPADPMLENAEVGVTSRPRSRPTSPEINRTITPINAETKRLPESYESLVTRPPGVPPRRRKYATKGPRIVREPTPGPDLEVESKSQTPKAEEEEEAPVPAKRSIDVVEARARGVSFTPGGSDSVDEEVVGNLDSPGSYDAKRSKMPSEGTVGSNDDSGFESQTRTSGRPITDAVTEWLKRVNASEAFAASAGSSDAEGDSDGDDESPKNLQGNPMPALSVNPADDGEASSVVGGRGESGRVKVTEGGAEGATGKRKVRSRSRRKSERRAESKARNGEPRLARTTQRQPGNARPSVVGEEPRVLPEVRSPAPEVIAKDSAAGVRVASSSRMASTEVDGKESLDRGDLEEAPDAARDLVHRSSPSGKTDPLRGPHRGWSEVDLEKGGFAMEDPVTGWKASSVERVPAVRTFEKGEVVTLRGKLLPLRRCEISDDWVLGRPGGRLASDRPRDEERDSLGDSLGSIDEPDVLECWEVETVEPWTTLQGRGVFRVGEAAEEDEDEARAKSGSLEASKERVGRYYRLARESVTSPEEDATSRSTVHGGAELRYARIEPVPEEVPVDESLGFAGKKEPPVDEAFEAYESCYTGRPRSFSPISDSVLGKPGSLRGKDEQGAVPCRAVCCNIQ
ncbi:serine/arginine repetitive matrix protein 1 isoform X1 [Orussus abietinus]|uniref:serine/arginine repetitive matrix protein 1 isoform X1 n=1 Tax=Orussus abietinus TaxID=222816 RepID=UPI0006256393|nr:serine/arginine repetitive matrix protein 1 isoform X1 [Orussus abietinus]